MYSVCATKTLCVFFEQAIPFHLKEENAMKRVCYRLYVVLALLLTSGFTAAQTPTPARSSTLFTAASPESMVRCKSLVVLKNAYPFTFVLSEDLEVGEMDVCRSGRVTSVHTDGLGNPLVLPAGTIVRTKESVSQQVQLVAGLIESVPSATGSMIAGCGNEWRKPKHPLIVREPPRRDESPPRHEERPLKEPPTLTSPPRVCDARIGLELKPLKWPSVKKGLKGHVFDALFTIGISAMGGGWVGPTIAGLGTIGGGMAQDAMHPLVYAVTANIDGQAYPFASPFQTFKHRDFDVELRLAQNPSDSESLMAEVNFPGYPNCYRAIPIPKNRNNTWVIAFGNPLDKKQPRRTREPRGNPAPQTVINNIINNTQTQTQQQSQLLSNPQRLVWSKRQSPPAREVIHQPAVPPRPSLDRAKPPERVSPPSEVIYKAPIQRGKLP